VRSGWDASAVAARSAMGGSLAGHALRGEMDEEMPETGPDGAIAVYESAEGEVRIDVRLERETVCLTQRQMAQVFDATPENVPMHLRNVFASRELEADATTKEFLVVRTESTRRVQRTLKHYKLDAIVSVGYRINSRRSVRFRQSATRTLRDHLVRGYRLNEPRLAERACGKRGRASNCWLGHFATRPWWAIPGRRCWTLSPVTLRHGNCCWSSTRIGC